MSRAIKEFRLAKQKFEKLVPKDEIQVVNDIRDRIRLAGERIDQKDLNASFLSIIEERLARYSEYLGDIYSNYDTEAEWTKAWIDEQKAKRYSEIKELIKTEQGKVTVTEIEMRLNSEYFIEKSDMIMKSGQARKYKMILAAIDRVILALTHRIRQLESDYKKSNI